ncbi:MAG TPA: SufE family protein [Rhizobiales bacterium]|nr:SufE family protein [Hyphomicrobiales bacterium]
MSIQQLIEDFEFIEDWEEKYRYIIELGRNLEPFPESERNEQNKVHGCVSQVWLLTAIETNEEGEPVLTFTGDSDAHIVRGLVSILLEVYSGKTAREILEIDGLAVLGQIGLQDHLTPQRSNGLASMVKRIQDEARKALESSSPSISGR